MKPGRELDILVAEKVMGWKQLTYAQVQPDNQFHKDDHRLTGYWYSDDLKEQELSADCLDYYQPKDAWSPSTNIADAWQLLKYLNSQGWLPKILSEYDVMNDRVVWRCSLLLPGINEVSVDFKELDETPLAISLAALKAVDNG